ncbi:MAG: hypothetical protein WCW77_01185 [Patescibacteria group bacterium]|jgi:hypothetical protein
MPDNFSQTVDLREEAERKKKNSKPKESDFEKVYGREGEARKKELQKISVPRAPKEANPAFRYILIVFAVILVGAGIWFLFFRGSNTASKPEANLPKGSNWNAVKLVDGEIFYGQIKDTKSDPVVIENVYYNYEQAQDVKKEVDETANLKLVKRGKETHGPTGSLNVVRSQIIYMEPLAEDSKVLQAILEYEK